MNKKQTIKRIVVKIGSSTLTHDTERLNLRRVETLARVLSDIKNGGCEVILVSSGAVSAGVAKNRLSPADLHTRKAGARRHRTKRTDENIRQIFSRYTDTRSRRFC